VIEHVVAVEAPSRPLARERQLAWLLAKLAADPVSLEEEVVAAVADRVIDTLAVAAAALDRGAPTSARAMALGRRGEAGALLLGEARSVRVECGWAAWANGTAARELDFNDTFLAADYAHPSDAIAPLLAVAQQCGASGRDLCRAIATAYEVQVALTRAICLHAHGIDHVAHLGPAVVAGVGALLRLPVETIYHAIGQALHVSCATRQSRKGTISSWKAFAPGWVAKAAIEAVDRCLCGETSPSPIYEGGDGVIARLLDGPEARYRIALPAPGEPRRAILDTYPKAHSAEYQAQALIDLALDLRGWLRDAIGGDWSKVASIVIHGSHHTHRVIGTGSGDPQKHSSEATRETLDHSAPYIFAVALQDGAWHHERSYAPARARRSDTVELWQKITTVEDPAWTERYHATDPRQQAFGGRAVISLAGGRQLSGELAVAHAHPRGRRPFGRADYLHKFQALTSERVTAPSAERCLAAIERLDSLAPSELAELHLAAPEGQLAACDGSGGLQRYRSTD
jgi:2-methylcitrate dehydratase